MTMAGLADGLLLSSTALLLVFLVCRLLRRRPSALPLPPGPRGIPILGALPFIGSAPHEGLARLAKRHGPIMYLNMGTTPTVVASTPSAARAFLKAHDAKFAHRPPIASTKYVTYNSQDLIFCRHPTWKTLRRLSALHMLGARAMADWSPIRRSEVGHLLRSLLRSPTTTLPETLIHTMANVISQVAFSVRVFEEEGKESSEYKDMITDLMNGGSLNSIGDFVPEVAWLDLQGVHRMLRRVHRQFDSMISKLMAEHASSPPRARPDFLDLVMANRMDADGETISDDNIKGLIFDMFAAGTDTATVIMEWAMAEMLLNPKILRRAQLEMDDVIGRSRRLEESDIPSLPYLQAVCKEALRKHPSTPLSLPHYNIEPCEVEGFYIPARTRLIVNIWAIGRDPEAWEEPLEFRPERFLSERGKKIEPLGNDFEFIPFGAGRRICAGKQAGLLMVQYVLGSLVHAFDWRMKDGVEIDMAERFGITLLKAVPLVATASPRLEPEAYE